MTNAQAIAEMSDARLEREISGVLEDIRLLQDGSARDAAIEDLRDLFAARRARRDEAREELRA